MKIAVAALIITNLLTLWSHTDPNVSIVVTQGEPHFFLNYQQWAAISADLTNGQAEIERLRLRLTNGCI